MIRVVLCAILCIVGRSRVLNIDCNPPCRGEGCELQRAIPDISKAMKELHSEIRELEKKFMFSPILPDISDVFFDSKKKLVITIGQYSAGKTTMASEVLSRLSEGNLSGYPSMTIAENVTNEVFYVIHGDDPRCFSEPGDGIMEDTILCNVAAWFHKKEITNSKNWHAYFKDVHLCDEGLPLDSLRDYVFVDSPGFLSEEEVGRESFDKRKSFRRFWRGVLLRADMILVLVDQKAADLIPWDSEFADALQFSRALETRVRIGVNKVASNPCRKDQKKFRNTCGTGFSKTRGGSGQVILPQNSLFTKGILPQLRKLVFGGGVVPTDKLFFTNWGHDCDKTTCLPEDCSCDLIKEDEKKLVDEIMDNNAHKRHTLRATSLMSRWTLLEMHLRVMKKLQKDASFKHMMKEATNKDIDTDTAEFRTKVLKIIKDYLKDVQCVSNRHRECCVEEGTPCSLEDIYRAYDVEDLAQYLSQESEHFVKMAAISADTLKSLTSAKIALNNLLAVQCKPCSRNWFGRITCESASVSREEL
eukprot:TRINITY_DN8873_c0_g1_i1.p1 TRINITY_DN8873_c0_g1~~TRINITY_DN8873_c0_g1_i1.p1  ORF type:complete len:530 (-),score=70.88 TRINITY_DN8873_c0_g1_i1:222-1811(-)